MTSTDWILDIALIGIVLIQVRGRTLTAWSLLLPLGIVAYVAYEYLHDIPTGTNDILLIGALTAVGLILGTLAGIFTSVTTGAQGRPFAKAGFVAAALWVLGCGFRLAFQLYAYHGGGESIVRFDAHHGLGIEAWVAAIILMAIGEALSRTAVIAARAFVLPSGTGARGTMVPRVDATV